MKRTSGQGSLPTPESKYARQEMPPLNSDELQWLRENARRFIGSNDDGQPNPNLDAIYLAVSYAIVLSSGGRPPSLVREDLFKENVQRESAHFFEVLRKAALKGAPDDDVQALADHSVFWTSPSPRTRFEFEPQAPSVSLESQYSAIENSWKADFVGQSPLNGLKAHIAEQLKSDMSSEKQGYGHYCSIVQSSGMGKSRLLDEFSKNYFLIPINLRGPQDQGYPPADYDIRNFLTGGQGVPHSEAVSLVEYFLLALFNETKETLESMGTTKSIKIRNFRNFMSKGQTMGSAGKDRNAFYKRVVTRAKQPQSEASGSRDKLDDLKEALDGLRKVLNSDGRWFEHCISATKAPKNDSELVDVFIMFDEAHTLSESFDDKDESRFVVLRRALNGLSSSSLFSFFLSTTGSITQFAKPRGQDASNRINDGLLSTPRPYIYLGFDQLMKNRKVLARWTTLDDVTSLECAAHMGRPLWGTRYDHGDGGVRQSLIDFAIQKLLYVDPPERGLKKCQLYAVLSQRLALDIHTPQYLSDPASPLDAIRTMHDQIANHMRVCVAVGDGIESLRGIAPSEPILSEAASRVMLSKGFILPSALSLVLTGFSIDQGERGELLVAAFFTWARDRAAPKVFKHERLLCHYFSVNELFTRLFSKSTFELMSKSLPSLCHTETRRQFGQVFGKAKMHFNHVLKPQVQELLKRKFLLYFMARGAAAFGANGQPGFDAVYPYLYDGVDLDVKKIGFIIVQVKNDSGNYRENCKIFKKMDPFKCHLLDDSDMEDGRFPIPIIRIVFSLSATKDPDFIQMEYKGEPSKGAETLGEDGQPLFTSYDYVCSGTSPEILQPVTESPDLWKELVNKRNRWDGFYSGSAPDVLRSQFPGCGANNAHFSSWLDRTVFP